MILPQIGLMCQTKNGFSYFWKAVLFHYGPRPQGSQQRTTRVKHRGLGHQEDSTYMNMYDSSERRLPTILDSSKSLHLDLSETDNMQDITVNIV